tara:strand:- start:74 stop:700 length:627 start_codon:yes stop_codon:yes gene_type:complete
MKKVMKILFASLFFMSAANAGGMIGVKYGVGELDGERTSNGDSSGVKSGQIDSEYGAVFAELNLADSMFSIGAELVPLEGVIDTLDSTGTDSQVTVEDLLTLYVLGSIEMDFGSLYGKVGYASADLSAVANYGQTLSDMSDKAEGPMIGAGIQFDLPTPIINTMRLEATHTDFDSLKISSKDEDGGATENRTGEADLTTFSISLARSF